MSGLISIAFGTVLFARPGMGAVALALLFGLFNLVYGSSAFVQGIDLRRTDRSLGSLFDEPAGIGANVSDRSHGQVRSVV